MKRRRSRHTAQLFKAVPRPELQPKGEKAQKGVAHRRGGGEAVQRLPENDRVIEHLRRAEDGAHAGQNDAGKERDDESAVAVIKAINRKRRPAVERTSPALHGVRLQRERLNEPSDQHGENAKAVHEPFPDIPLIAAAADALLGEINAHGLAVQARDEPQQYREKEREPRTHAPEEIHDLVGRHDAEESAAPHAHARRTHAEHEPIDKALRCHVVPNEVLPQHGHAEVVISGIGERKKQNERQETEIENERAPSAPPDAVGKRGGVGDGEKHWVRERDTAIERGGEENKIHRRVAELKPHRLPPSRIGASSGRAFRAGAFRKSAS